MGAAPTSRMAAVQHYEYIFWAMAAVVALALASGAALGRCGSVARSLAGVALAGVVVLAAVALLASRAGLGDLAALLSVASFMFFLVIGTAATLLARRVRHQRLARRAPGRLG